MFKEKYWVMRFNLAIKITVAVAIYTLVTNPAATQSSSPSTSATQGAKSESMTTKMPEGMTKEQGDEILKELKSIHQLLERQAVAPSAAPTSDQVRMNLAPGWHSLGSEDAPVTVVEFADYQCPFCRKFHSETFAELKKNYIDTGKVRFVSRDLPLDIHPNASGAAMAARCAGDQNKFWEMHDLMLANNADLSSGSLLNFGKQISLDMNLFNSCLKDKKYSTAVQKDVSDAGAMGIGGTPSFVIGRTAKDQIKGVRIAGAIPYPTFEIAIKNQLNPSQ